MPDPHRPDPPADLPPGLLPHVEAAARAVHERWMAGRLAEGWTYGPRRDDDARTHPGLVPYEALPDSEREYDRQTVRAAVTALLDLGFRIEPPRDGRPGA